jgi:hypothetical protein
VQAAGRWSSSVAAAPPEKIRDFAIIGERRTPTTK